MRASLRGGVRGTPSSLRILAVTNLWPSETKPWHGVFVASQMRSVARLGVDVDVVFVDGGEHAGAYVVGALRMLALNFRRRRYDLIHAHAGHCAFLARLQWRYPVLVSYLGYDVHGKLKADGSATIKSRLEGTVFRQLARFVDATITKSSEMEQRLPAAARPRNTVLPNGVDRERFRPISREQARLRLGWPEEELTVLFAGRADFPRKRVDVARKASELAGRKLPGVHFRVCDRLPHDAVPVHMCAADVLVLPSLAEGSPNVVKEALACNLPVVANAVGDVTELLGDVDRCRALPLSATAEDFAEALVDVLREAPDRNNGRIRTEHLGAEVIAERLFEIYRSVASGSKQPAAEPKVRDLASL
jgi:teichuronic acid biosynthesis glycosyltransferase TuaC